MDKYPKTWKNWKHLNLGSLNLFRKIEDIFIWVKRRCTGYLAWPSTFSTLLWAWEAELYELCQRHPCLHIRMWSANGRPWQEMKGWSRLTLVVFPPAPSLPVTMSWPCTCTRGHKCCQAASPCNCPPNVLITIPPCCTFRTTVVIAPLLSLPLEILHNPPLVFLNLAHIFIKILLLNSQICFESIICFCWDPSDFESQNGVWVGLEENKKFWNSHNEEFYWHLLSKPMSAWHISTHAPPSFRMENI